jgi:HEPN domain-containing protein
MPSSNKAFRELIGYTFLKAGADPESWFKQANQFHSAALLLYPNDQGSLIQVCFHVAGLSLELALKAIILAKSKSFNTTHTLGKLVTTAGITVSADQEFTLELLSECIIWRGRYPTPTSEKHWDKYHDDILEKHIVRQQNGNTSRVLKNMSRFPTLENYQALWDTFENEFKKSVNHQS